MQTGPHTLAVYFHNGTYMRAYVCDQWTLIRVVCIMNVVGPTDAVGINSVSDLLRYIDHKLPLV